MSGVSVGKRLYVEEYRIWKRNTPFLYDYVVSKALEWPSLTCEWLPGRSKVTGTDYFAQSILLGTHTTGNEQNYLMIADVRSPDYVDEDAAEPQGEADGTVKSKLQEVEKVSIVQKINHEGEVNRARAMPQNCFLVATKSPNGQVLVFDTSRHMLKPSIAETCSPQLRLGGHKKEGYGICWNKRTEGQLLSGSDDALICMWDIAHGKKVGDVIDPARVFSGHQQAVQDVAWHYNQPQIFGSVGDDKKLMLWDMRSPDRSRPFSSVRAHEQEVNCLAFNPEVDSAVVTGSTDSTIALWDIRSLHKCLHTLKGHEGDVFQVAFSPKSAGILASASADRRVMVWNLGKIQENSKASDAGDELPPELLFVHSGHTEKLNDISWNPDDVWSLASVAEDNIVQCWSPGSHITNADEADAQVASGEHGKPKDGKTEDPKEETPEKMDEK
uniref:Histone-binding protein RBBP4-like N-terminal domain-containing protein n=1 Tax=Rhodosorus marinus TaxID=101924 RepID=A0A7S3A4U1_9RHOD|mmetsp:Transcript_4279/g.18262  ORF Transcript_4279/g.18262 Transcript_4279/m.18262 type:complete len:442 (+) Transcript_4279:177-1502(+)